jgi:hypothetical protein
MSNRVVAICSGSKIFANNKILRKEIAKNFPGALWIPILAERLKQRGISTMTGDVALSKVNSSLLKAKDIWVIQDDLNPEADALIALGAKGKVLLCFESPLFAANFYQNLYQVSLNFEHSIVFKGVKQEAFPLVKAHTLFFPSFDESNPDELPWSTKKYLVMVAGNKYWKIYRSPIRKFAAQIRDYILCIPDRFSKIHSSSQLHDERLAAISYFGRIGRIDLFGNGWGNLDNLPVHWQNELKETVRSLNPLPCPDKLSTISNYKFALCFENISYPGYVTEKIIDCLVAGVVPIYWGAPDILDFIPDGCFIDPKKFSSLDVLDAYLDNLSEVEWNEFVRQGQDFLKSNAGQSFTYAHFSEQVELMLIE